MAIDILMPQLGETVAEGKVTVWHKLVGDRVMHGDALFEIESDKSSMEVPAIVSGILTRINVNAGESAAVGAVVAVIDGEAQSALEFAEFPERSRSSARFVSRGAYTRAQLRARDVLPSGVRTSTTRAPPCRSGAVSI